jgi:phosphotriesterase-related protein
MAPNEFIAPRRVRSQAMSNVETVRGPVDTSELGRTYMHEHVFVLTPEVQQNYPEHWGSEDDRVADAVAKLTALAAQGVSTIADPTVIGLGRYIPRIQRIAAQVPALNIIVATGCYTYDSVPKFFHYRGPALNAALGVEVPDPMVDMFVGDITDGIADTGVKAAFLKCAIDYQGMTDDVARIMRAVAQAHRQTGAPITIHTHPGSQTGFAARTLLRAEGVDPTRVVLGHSGDTTDLDYLSELADDGFILGMDRFGINVETTFEARADTVAAMCARGYADRMVLAHDASCYLDWMDPNIAEFMAAQWHYLHIGDDVLPYLREHGVTEQQIDTMLVDVPRRYFEAVSAY